MLKLHAFKRPAVSAMILFGSAVLVMSSALIAAQQSRHAAITIESLAARVKQMEDVQEISNVLIEYGRALDSRDFKAYSALFAKDGSWSGGMGTVTGGPQAIYDFMTSRIGGGAPRGDSAGDKENNAANTGRPAGGFGTTYHIMSNFKVDVKGDNAIASSRWTFVSAARGPGIQVAGRYEDTFVRENGVWKFKSRQAFNDVTAPAAAAAANGR
jgi:SnoaL-like domain